MDRRHILLLLLMELWHLETMCTCTIVGLLMLKLRRRRAETDACLINSDRIMDDSDTETVNNDIEVDLEDEQSNDGSEVVLEDDLSNNASDVDLEDDASASITKEGTLQSQVSTRKRKRHDEDIIIIALERMTDEYRKGTQMLVDAIRGANEDRSDIAEELKNMGLSVPDQIEALKILLEKPP